MQFYARCLVTEPDLWHLMNAEFKDELVPRAWPWGGGCARRKTRT